jgi:hypothetical protein
MLRWKVVMVFWICLCKFLSSFPSLFYFLYFFPVIEYMHSGSLLLGVFKISEMVSLSHLRLCVFSMPITFNPALFIFISDHFVVLLCVFFIFSFGRSVNFTLRVLLDNSPPSLLICVAGEMHRLNPHEFSSLYVFASH